MTERVAVGEELDGEVARLALGGAGAHPEWYWWSGTGDDAEVLGFVGPHFSTDIAAAWTVVEHFRMRGWLVTVKDMPPGYPYLSGDDPLLKLHRRAVCEMQWMPLSTAADCRRSIYRHPRGAADTPAEAICRAALEAVEAVEAVEAERDVTAEEITDAWKPRV